MLRYVRDPAPRGSPPPDRTPRGGPPRDGTMDHFGNCHGRDRPDGRVVSMVVSTLSSAHAHRRVRVVPFLTCCRPPDRGRRKKSPALLSRTRARGGSGRSAPPRRRYAAQGPGREPIHTRIAQRRVDVTERPAATSDLAWDLGPVTILSMQPTRGFPNTIHPGGLYRRAACTHQCTPSSRQHTSTPSHRQVRRQAGPPGPATWTRPRGRTCPSGFLHCTLERSPNCDPCARLTGGSNESLRDTFPIRERLTGGSRMCRGAGR